MPPGEHPAAVQRQPYPDKSKDVASPRQPNRTAISKNERYREILAVLARHGIGVVDDEFIKHQAGDRARAEHLRQACEELGTMFIKLGQMLSTRSDLLPEAYRTELAKLQDEVAPLPADAIANVIREDLGELPDKLFHHFANFRLPHLGSSGEVDFPVSSQPRRGNGFVADQLVCALLSHFYLPVYSNAQGTLYCPSKASLGRLGRAALALIGKFPAEEVTANLHRLKEIIETGKVTDTSYAVAGKFSQRPNQRESTK